MTDKASRHGEMSLAERFRKTARALECDEDEARFREKLGKIAKAKPVSEKTSRK